MYNKIFPFFQMTFLLLIYRYYIYIRIFIVVKSFNENGHIHFLLVSCFDTSISIIDYINNN